MESASEHSVDYVGMCVFLKRTSTLFGTHYPLYLKQVGRGGEGWWAGMRRSGGVSVCPGAVPRGIAGGAKRALLQPPSAGLLCKVTLLAPPPPLSAPAGLFTNAPPPPWQVYFAH